MKSVGIIGFGLMGEAIGAGLRRVQPERRWGVFEKIYANAEKARLLSGDIFPSLEELCRESEILVLAVKPQDMVAVCKALEPYLNEKLVVSVAAGVTIKSLISWLGSKRAVRWMPNLAAAVGECLVGIAHADGLSEEDVALSLELAQAIGRGSVVPERLINAVTGVSGSGIAYVFSVVNGLALGGVRQGLPYKQALDFAVHACLGAAALLRDNGIHPEEMVSRVCSPAGTTIEGIHLLENGGIRGLLIDAVSVAVERATELEN